MPASISGLPPQGQKPWYATFIAWATGIVDEINAKVSATRTVAGKPLSADVTLVKGDVGLGNVDNTSDANKPVSTAVSNALGLKADTSALSGYVPTTRTVANKALSANVTLVKGDVGLGNVDNTSDAAKPISTATQTALNLKVDSADVDTLVVTTEALKPASPAARTIYFVAP